jgi:uncharacterized protein YndB with AHSA1/START domain
VRNTSTIDAAGERVLRFELVANAGGQQVWLAFTTTAGLSTWFSPQAIVDFKPGGAVISRDRSAERIGDTGIARLDIISYQEQRTIIFHVDLDETFSETIREQDDELREIVELMPLDTNRTALSVSVVGWGKGRIWDDAYAFFVKRIEAACVRLLDAVSTRNQNR